MGHPSSFQGERALHCPCIWGGDARRQGRDAEGQETGMMGTEVMTPLRDIVAHGTQESGTADLNSHPT